MPAEKSLYHVIERQLYMCIIRRIFEACFFLARLHFNCRRSSLCISAEARNAPCDVDISKLDDAKVCIYIFFLTECEWRTQYDCIIYVCTHNFMMYLSAHRIASGEKERRKKNVRRM